MKIKLLLSDEKAEEIKQMLISSGFEIDDAAELIIMQRDTFPSHLAVRNEEGMRLNISVEDIVFIESYGHDVDVHTAEGVYKSSDRLYQLCAALNPECFLRISNSVIISRKHVRKIRPSLSMKFILTMSDGTLVDVTRSYYSTFREFFKI